MVKKKHYLYLNESEHSILIKSLVELKNKLTQQGRFSDCVDDLLLKVIAAPMKRIQYIPQPLTYKSRRLFLFPYIAVCLAAGG